MPMRVLVVEDNPDMGANLGAGAARAGIRRRLVDDGRRASSTPPPGSTTC